MRNFVEELRWRGMIQDIMPETEQHLLEGLRAAYVGIDPTADSLHRTPGGGDDAPPLPKLWSQALCLSRRGYRYDWRPFWEIYRTKLTH